MSFLPISYILQNAGHVGRTTLYNVFSVLWGAQHCWGAQHPGEKNKSTMGDVQYHEGYHDKCGGYNEYCGWCSVLWGIPSFAIIVAWQDIMTHVREFSYGLINWPCG